MKNNIWPFQVENTKIRSYKLWDFPFYMNIIPLIISGISVAFILNVFFFYPLKAGSYITYYLPILILGYVLWFPYLPAPWKYEYRFNEKEKKCYLFTENLSYYILYQLSQITCIIVNFCIIIYIIYKVYHFFI
jgi:hypothetical protein